MRTAEMSETGVSGASREMTFALSIDDQVGFAAWRGTVVPQGEEPVRDAWKMDEGMKLLGRREESGRQRPGPML